MYVVYTVAGRCGARKPLTLSEGDVGYVREVHSDHWVVNFMLPTAQGVHVERLFRVPVPERILTLTAPQMRIAAE